MSEQDGAVPAWTEDDDRQARVGACRAMAIGFITECARIMRSASHPGVEEMLLLDRMNDVLGEYFHRVQNPGYGHAFKPVHEIAAHVERLEADLAALARETRQNLAAMRGMPHTGAAPSVIAGQTSMRGFPGDLRNSHFVEATHFAGKPHVVGGTEVDTQPSAAAE